MNKKSIASVISLFIGAFIFGFCMIVFGRMLMPTPAISVVMSTYNRSDLLPRAIISVLNQTYTDFEFIIVEDGSSDGTLKILQEYAAQDKRIKILENGGNKGLIYSLNRGLDAARGKYIARMDDDDISLLVRFEKQLRYMEEHPEIIVVGSKISAPGSMIPYSFQQETDVEKVKILPFLANTPIAHPASFMRRDFLEKHNIRYKSKYKAVEDRAFFQDIQDAGGMITNIPEVLLQFRLHFSNPTSYYADQYTGTRVFHLELLERFLGEKAYSNISKCEKYELMIEANKTKKLLNQEKLEQLIEEKCSQEKNQH